MFQQIPFVSKPCLKVYPITVSGPAFSVVRHAGGGGEGGRVERGAEAQMPKIKVYINRIEMKLGVSHYDHKSIPDTNVESGSSSSFEDMTSQNFPRNKGTSHQIRLFMPGKGA